MHEAPMRHPQGPAAADAPADAVARAAWLYYVHGLTQQAVADQLGVTRARIIAWLAAARDAGIVNVRIDAKTRRQATLESALCGRYRLQRAEVVPSPSAPAATAALVGHAAGAFLADAVVDGTTAAVGWGATLHAAVRALGTQPRARVAVVALLGGPTHSRAMTPPAVARRLADAFAAECFQLTAPLVVASDAMRIALWNEPPLRTLRARARHADLALLSVGGLSADATLFDGGLLPRGLLASLRRAGAVGDVLGHFVDADGRVVDHPINRRIMAVDLRDVRRVPRIVVASGGADKVAALRAALRALPVHTLITDENAAAGLVDG
jgi:DNA-binding transcriptional regulator LsrR (DeoR family)